MSAADVVAAVVALLVCLAVGVALVWLCVVMVRTRPRPVARQDRLLASSPWSWRDILVILGRAVANAARRTDG